MNRLFFSPLSFLLLTTSALFGAESDRTLSTSFLAKLRAEAARTHPAVKAEKLRAQATATEAQRPRLWEDPVAGLAVMGGPRMMRHDDGDLMFNVSQTLPKPGVFAARKDQLEALALAGQEVTGEARLKVGAEAVKAAVELALADASLSLQSAQVDWLKKMATTARENAASPDASSADALRLEAEVAKEVAVVEAIQRSRKEFAQRLNLSLGRSLDEAWARVQLPDAPRPIPLASAEIARLPKANPRMRSLKAKADAAGAETRLTTAERKPTLSIDADSSLYSGTGDLRETTVGVKISLPWFNDPVYRAKTDAAASRELAAEQDVEALGRELASRVTSLVTEATNSAAQAKAYSGEITKKSREAVEAVEAAWISSKASLTDLLDASRALFAVRLEQQRLLAAQIIALEELHVLVPEESNP